MNTPKKIELAECPICGKPVQEKYRPFCSLRCADIDLGRWLKGVYVTPSVDSEEDEKESQKEE